jgi:hypothetical protein
MYQQKKINMLKFIKIQDAKQEIEDKKREGKEKEKEKAEKEAAVKELKKQRAEIYKLQLADEKKEKDANKRLATLSKISTPKPEEVEEITQLNKEIPEIQKRIAEFVKTQTDLEAKYLPMETTEIPNLVTDIKTLLTEIKTIQTVDIPALETALEQSEKDIITYQENVDENNIIENEQLRKIKK